ncbi:spore coat protein CotJB [Rossellomorea vietnamensis]|uniref:Spore coat protein CotJB n=1 Tax=Rossellomorea vietnamensis TaxID=218284 RepID=A0A5D4NHI2_9BACI|nr:spore coat protein CotJB [Rossellomorea vietnamensis]TYS13259.1 spore coat protein CotJB [Rossellomorea vietnamensis]
MKRQALLERRQIVEFALLDLQLYFDTRAADKIALKQFNQLSAVSQELKALYERKFSPLLGNGFSQSKMTWQWVNSPWPWQIDRRC